MEFRETAREAQVAPDTRTTVRVVLDHAGIRRTTTVLLGVVAVLAAMNALSLFITHGLDRPEAGRDLLDLNREGSVGTWVNGVLAAACGVLALVCAAQQRQTGGRWCRQWRVLAAAFLYVSADELLAIHERASAAVQPALGTSGALYFAWVIPATALVAALGLYLLPFLAALPSNIRRRLVAAATIFLLGAVGLELVESSVYVPGQEQQSLIFDGLSAVEEVMELSAFVLTLTALLRHLLADRRDVVVGSSGRTGPRRSTSGVPYPGESTPVAIGPDGSAAWSGQAPVGRPAVEQRT